MPLLIMSACMMHALAYKVASSTACIYTARCVFHAPKSPCVARAHAVLTQVLHVFTQVLHVLHVLTQVVACAHAGVACAHAGVAHAYAVLTQVLHVLAGVAHDHTGADTGVAALLTKSPCCCMCF